MSFQRYFPKLLRPGIELLCDSEVDKCFPGHCHCARGVVVLKFSRQAVSYLSVWVLVSAGKRKRKLLFLYFHSEVWTGTCSSPRLKLLSSLPFCLPYMKFSKECERSFGLCQILSVYKEAQNYVLGDFLIFLMPVISIYSGNRIYDLTGTRHKHVEWETTPE